MTRAFPAAILARRQRERADVIDRIAEMANYLASDRDDAAWPAQMDKPGSATRLATARDLVELLAEVERLRLAASHGAATLRCLADYAEPEEILGDPEGFGGPDDAVETLSMAYDNMRFAAERGLARVEAALAGSPDA
jgi:hypothetical protein